MSIVEGHADKHKRAMFQSAVDVVTKNLKPITSEARKSAQTIVDELLDSISANYSACWEVSTRTLTLALACVLGGEHT